MNKEKNAVMVYNNGQYEQELICAEKWMRLIYENPIGSASLPFLVKRKIFSKIYGLYCKTPVSAKKIPDFIKKYNVDMSGCKDSYESFADFFSREKEGLQYPAEQNLLGSPCEGLASAYTDLDCKRLIGAKGSFYSLTELFKSRKLAEAYEGGSMLKIRLTPANYHRMHFFDSGVITASKIIDGDLHSVSPIAVNRLARLYCRNKRALILFKTENFGNVVMLEVGATFVGSIVHCFEDGDKVERGQLGSYFLPGGSLLLVFFEKGKFSPADFLTEQTAKGFESRVNAGAILGGNNK